MEKIDILSLSLEELENILIENGEKKFRAKQIFQWLHVKRVFDFSKMTDISVQLRQSLSEIFCIKGLFVQKKLESAIDNTVKYLYRLPDGNFVETVLMQYNYGTSILIIFLISIALRTSRPLVGSSRIASFGLAAKWDAVSVLLQLPATSVIWNPLKYLCRSMKLKGTPE